MEHRVRVAEESSLLSRNLERSDSSVRDVLHVCGHRTALPVWRHRCLWPAGLAVLLVAVAVMAVLFAPLWTRPAVAMAKQASEKFVPLHASKLKLVSEKVEEAPADPGRGVLDSAMSQITQDAERQYKEMMRRQYAGGDAGASPPAEEKPRTTLLRTTTAAATPVVTVPMVEQPEWEVVGSDYVNVRSERSLESTIIDTKRKGSTIIGTAEGDWVLQSFAPGYCKITINESRHVLLRKRMAMYTKIMGGSCGDFGRHPITDPIVCKAAVAGFGINDQVLDWKPKTSQHPGGCFLMHKEHLVFMRKLASTDGEGGTLTNPSPVRRLANEELCSNQPYLSLISSESTPVVTTTEALATTSTKATTPTTTSTEATHAPLLTMRTTAAPTLPATTAAPTLPVTITATKTTTTVTVTPASTTQRGLMVERKPPETAPTPEWHFPSLFCWLLFRKGDSESDLVKAQLEQRLGIFSCDEHLALSDTRVSLGYGVEAFPVGSPEEWGYAANKGWWGSYNDSAVYIDAWKFVVADGTFRSHDWVVKVDPDTVFFPNRIRTHLKVIHRPIPKMYIKNHPPLWINDLDPRLHPSPACELFGPLEVISSTAVDDYVKRHESCLNLVTTNKGAPEDWFTAACMDQLKIEGYKDYKVMAKYPIDQDSCANGWTASFHPFRSKWLWFECFAKAAAAMG